MILHFEVTAAFETSNDFSISGRLNLEYYGFTSRSLNTLLRNQ